MLIKYSQAKNTLISLPQYQDVNTILLNSYCIFKKEVKINVFQYHSYNTNITSVNTSYELYTNNKLIIKFVVVVLKEIFCSKV